jgi:phage terminase large subunit GpA-like protein
VIGQKVEYEAVSLHRRHAYKYGELPQQYARKYSGGPIRFLTCQVDVHHRFLAVAVMGWTQGRHCYLVSYEYFEDKTEQGCESSESPVWKRVEDLIERRSFGGMRPTITFVDANWAPSYDTVVNFCSQYEAGVYPIIGRPRVGKGAINKEFREWQTQSGTFGYQIQVDFYKDRIASVLRRAWTEGAGQQPEFHFNAPIDATESQLKELTREVRREKVDEWGVVSYIWHRPGNARNELWDLLVYGHAAVEILAWEFCTIGAQMESTDWEYFWNEVE